MAPLRAPSSILRCLPNLRTGAAVVAPTLRFACAGRAFSTVGAPEADPAVEVAKQRVRYGLSERYLLKRNVEREGLRRIIILCLLVIGYKFVKNKFFGRTTDKGFV